MKKILAALVLCTILVPTTAQGQHQDAVRNLEELANQLYSDQNIPIPLGSPASSLYQKNNCSLIQLATYSNKTGNSLIAVAETCFEAAPDSVTITAQGSSSAPPLRLRIFHISPLGPQLALVLKTPELQTQQCTAWVDTGLLALSPPSRTFRRITDNASCKDVLTQLKNEAIQSFLMRFQGSFQLSPQ